MKRTVFTVLVAALVVLAGCSGASPGGPSADGGTPTDGDTPTDGGAGDSSTTDGGDTGTVRFYVSDEQAAIDDFEHLNVTITSITFHRAGGDSDDGNESEDEESEGDDEEDESADDETTDVETAEPTATPTNATATEGGDDDDDGDDGDDGDDRDGGEPGSKIQVDVDSNTVDLTELKGENATLVESYDLPTGKYTKVFLHVGEVDGTLTDGTQVNVKLPSDKLQLNKGFTLQPNKTVSFVYDVSVVKAGNSGKYILKPVISESGADQEFRDVGGDEEDEDESETESEDEDEDDESEDEAKTAGETTETPDDAGGPPTGTAG